jgi:hypothetical protein
MSSSTPPIYRSSFRVGTMTETNGRVFATADEPSEDGDTVFPA